MSAMKRVHCFRRVRVGYEMVEGNEVRSALLAFRRLVGYNHLVSNKREWNNCFTKNAHKISSALPTLFL